MNQIEMDHVTKICEESHSVLRHPPEPVCLEEPPMSGLNHLREMAVDVTLPWNWDSDSGDDS